MITGTVNSRREAMIQFAVLGENNQQQAIKAIIDTGYTGFLTLPSAIITALRLTWYMQEEGFLGDYGVHHRALRHSGARGDWNADAAVGHH